MITGIAEHHVKVMMHDVGGALDRRSLRNLRK